MLRPAVAGATLVAVLLALLGLAPAVAGAKARMFEEGEARGVAQEFVRTINTREYAKTCELLSARYYQENRVPDREQCAWRLTLSFAWSQAFRFKIGQVRVHGDRAVISALADGLAGKLLLIREDGAFKVLGLHDA